MNPYQSPAEVRDHSSPLFERLLFAAITRLSRVSDAFSLALLGSCALWPLYITDSEPLGIRVFAWFACAVAWGVLYQAAKLLIQE